MKKMKGKCYGGKMGKKMKGKPGGK